MGGSLYYTHENWIRNSDPQHICVLSLENMLGPLGVSYV